MTPSIKLDIDPHLIVQLGHGGLHRVGGVRVKTTIYVVEEPDIYGATTLTVQTVVVPRNARVELRIVE